MKRRFLSFLLLLLCAVSALFAQKEYYVSIDGVKGGAELKTALYNLVKEHQVIKYGSGENRTWWAFYMTDFVSDADGGRRVLDIYSSEKRYFGKRGESVSDMHIEHSLPKSWWGGDDKINPYFDLHHLRPADKSANQKKLNYPLAELSDVTWTNGVSSLGKADIEGVSITAFEPSDEYKGDFARMYMYMYTCYQEMTWTQTYMNYENSTYPTMKKWAVDMLLEWHNEDPVCEMEVERNNQVYDIQGNRNPYIDYPQLADYVWGGSVDKTFYLSGDGDGDVDGDEGRYVAITSVEKGKKALVKGVVVATNTRSFLVKDDSGMILVYLDALPDVEPGDEVAVSGVVDAYGGLLQFPATSVVQKTGLVKEVVHSSPLPFDGEAMDVYLEKPEIVFVEYSGTFAKSGSYYNVLVEGGETAIGSISYPVAGSVGFANGEEVSVLGYLTGVSGGKYVNTMAVAVSEMTEKAVTGEVADFLDKGFTGVANNYSEWQDKKANSGAVYSGVSAGGYGSIQMRTTNSNSGIVAVKSGGKVKKVAVEWNVQTTAGRTLDIYGKNSAYGSAADLYDAENQGVKLGSVVFGTSMELVVEGDYEYVGLRSNNGAMYLASVEIVWESGAYTLDIPASGWETVYLNFPVSVPDNADVYILTGVKDECLILEEVTGTIPANTAVVVNATEGCVVFQGSAAIPVEVSGNLLEGTNVNTYVDAGAYLLSESSGQPGFGRAEVGDGKFLNRANRAYLPAEKVSQYADMQFLGFRFDEVGDEGTTAVVVQREDCKGDLSGIYDLAGRRVLEITSPGIYIVEGVKLLK